MKQRVQGNRCSTRQGGLFATLTLSAIVLIALVYSRATAQDIAGVDPGAAYRIDNVVIEGNRRIESATIINVARIPTGESVPISDLNDSIQRVRSSGFFEEVNVRLDGSTLRIEIIEYPTVSRVEFEGNRRIKDEAIQAFVNSTPRRVFDPAEVASDVDKITSAYFNEGFLSARITPRIIRRPDNRVDLIFEIFEGGTVEIERMAFVGNRQFSDRRLRRVLATKQAGLLRALVRRDKFVEDRINFDQQLLRDFYAARGYVDFAVESVSSDLSPARDGWFITFNIHEGPQFHVGDISVTTDLENVDTELFREAIRMDNGTVHSPLRLDNDILRLEDVALRENLDFIRVEPRITRSGSGAALLDIEFFVTRGPRVFVERIDIEGNATTLDRVIRRQFKTIEGDPFNPRAIRASAERIRALNFFESSDVRQRPGSAEDQVVVEVEVKEKPTGTLSFGGTYSTDGGFGLTAALSERNFLGRGQRLSLSVGYSETSSDYGFEFYEPALLGRDLGFGLELNWGSSDPAWFRYSIEEGRFSPRISFPANRNGRFDLNAFYESSRVIPDQRLIVGSSILNDAAQGEQRSLGLGYAYVHDTRGSGIDPDTGYYFRLGQDFSLGGSNRFVRNRMRLSGVTKVFGGDVTLRGTLDAGSISYDAGSSRTADRFMMGPALMRGFYYGGIGPREQGTTRSEIKLGDTQTVCHQNTLAVEGKPGICQRTFDINDPLGGDHFAAARLEAEFPVGLPDEYGITGGLFYDIGALWGEKITKSRQGQYEEAVSSANTIYRDHVVVGEGRSFRHVVGLSIFWATPIGPLRFNFSRPITKEGFDKSRNFDMTIRTEF